MNPIIPSKDGLTIDQIETITRAILDVTLPISERLQALQIMATCASARLYIGAYVDHEYNKKKS